MILLNHSEGLWEHLCVFDCVHMCFYAGAVAGSTGAKRVTLAQTRTDRPTVPLKLECFPKRIVQNPELLHRGQKLLDSYYFRNGFNELCCSEQLSHAQVEICGLSSANHLRSRGVPKY